MSDHRGPADGEGLDAAADHLYGLPPDEFVPARDDAVAQAKDRGERDLARAIGRLRRPTRAAWLANLLARQRGEQLAGLITLAGDLAAAQRTLDGDALRALSSQRHRLVAAMAREAGQLARRAGEPATDAVLRELHGILEAALADPAIAAEVRSGRLTRTVTYSGFGPVADPDAIRHDPGPVAAGVADPQRPEREQADAQRADAERLDPARTAPTPDERLDHERKERERRERERQEHERRERERLERERRERELATAEQAQEQAEHRHRADADARDAADAAHDAARQRVALLIAELDAAQQHERTAATRRRAATSAAKESARLASAAAARTARARARLSEPPRPA